MPGGTNRRDFIAATSAAIAVLSHRPAYGATGADAEVGKLLAAIAEEMLADYPENATSLGIDGGAHRA